MDENLVDLVERAAQAREQPIVPREYIVQAIELAESGKEKIIRYSGGRPSLASIYKIAARLESKAAAKS